MDCLFSCPAKTWFLPHIMLPTSPTKTSKEVHVEVHPVPGEKPPKSSKRGTDKDRKKVIIDSRQNDEDMASAQINALQKSMEQGFPGWPSL